MRSIRRSLLGYLLLLLGLGLSAVGVLTYRLAGDALREREQAEERRIDLSTEKAREDVRDRFDAELLSESRARALDFRHRFEALLGQGPGRGPGGRDGRPGEPPAPDPVLQARPEEVHEFQVRAAAMLAGAGTTAGWPALPPALTVDPPARPARGPGGPAGRPPAEPPRPLNPAWLAFDAPRAVARIRDALRDQYKVDPAPGYFQFNLMSLTPDRVNRPGAVLRSPGLAADLPLDPAVLDPTGEVDHPIGDVPVPGAGQYRRITLARPNGWPLLFWVRQSAPAGLYPADPPGRRQPDLVVRAIVQQARPVADLDARLAVVAGERDEQLDRVRAGTRDDLARLRRQLWLIGGAAFAAFVVGGLAIVARGLAPLQKLSHAVSQVSEKDFRLPLGPDGLSRELAPIHERMTNTLDQLRRAFAREKQAVADISHELRTPIASLLATIDVTLRRPRSPDQYRNTLEDCRAIAKQLGQLVERIMTLASLDAGTARVAAARADGAAVAAECATLIRPLAEAHDLAFTLDAPDPVPLETDPDRLREVLVNLLHNAVEYNRPGGALGLAVRRDGGTAVFEVVDTGIGMTPEVRERIFERFYRADPSRHATGVHAGLGLAIVREYVDRLGGAIAVDTVPGQGTTFRVTLPAAPAPEPAPPARREPAAARS